MKKSSIAPRGSNIMSKIVAQRDVSITSAFKDEEVPAAGVLTDHEAELSKILNNINTWGLDVFTANEVIKGQILSDCCSTTQGRGPATK